MELLRIARDDGSIVHAEISTAGSVIMLGDPDDRLYGEPRRLGRCTAGLHIFSADNEQLFRRAVGAGAEAIQPPTEMFYGASSASVRDPFGHVWVILTWEEDLAPAEMERRGRGSQCGQEVTGCIRQLVLLKIGRALPSSCSRSSTARSGAGVRHRGSGRHRAASEIALKVRCG